MLKQLQQYVKQTNDSLIKEKAITNTPDTSISGLRVAILAASPAVTLFNNLTLSGDTTELPVLNLPNSTDTDFVIDGITITRSNISTTSTITDETIEDAVPDTFAALDVILASQTILKMENAIATSLTSASALVGSHANTFQTLITVLNSFPAQYNSIVGNWYVFGSHATLRNLLSSFTASQMELREIFGIEFIPVYGLPTDELVIGHGHGIAGGFNLNPIELDRRGNLNSATLLSSASAGIGFDTNFVKKVTVSV